MKNMVMMMLMMMIVSNRIELRMMIKLTYNVVAAWQKGYYKSNSNNKNHNSNN